VPLDLLWSDLDMTTQFILSNELNEKLQSENPPVVFDVRKRPAFNQDPDTIPTAKWQIHDELQNWALGISPEREIIVYCVHGHEVSQNAATGLRDMGLNASYLEGGFDAWKQAGLPVTKGNK